MWREFFLDMVVPSDMMDQVRDSMKKAPKEDDIDSEMSEVLSDLCHEEGNVGELKDMKDLRRKARLKRKGIPKDQPVDPPKKRKTGKGRGAGKGGKGKGRGKGKKGKKRKLVDAFVAFAQKRLKASQGGGNEPGEPEAPPSPVGSGTHPSPEEAPPPPKKLETTEEPESQLPQPSSSSSAQPHPSHEASQAQGPGPSSRASAPKLYKSPKDILSSITPPGAFIGLSSLEHRWTSRYPTSSKVVQGNSQRPVCHLHLHKGGDGEKPSPQCTSSTGTSTGC